MEQFFSIFAGCKPNGDLDINHSSDNGPTEAGVKDLYGLSIPLIVTPQLGTLQSMYSIQLCRSLLLLLSGKPTQPVPINKALKEIQIDLHKNDDYTAVVGTMKTRFGLFAKEDEQAVCQFLCNYARQVYGRATAEGKGHIYTSTLPSVYLYLVELLPSAVGQEGYQAKKYYPQVHQQILSYSTKVFSHTWREQKSPELLKELFNKSVTALRQYDMV